jgi:hypothetical protein
MDRILLMSLVGAAPGGVFGPGMNAGALEAFARDARSSEGGARGGSTAGSARRAAKDHRREQKGGADTSTALFGPASDARCGFLEFVVPH